MQEMILIPLETVDALAGYLRQRPLGESLPYWNMMGGLEQVTVGEDVIVRDGVTYRPVKSRARAES